jgi:hypothetical protein
VSSKLCLRAMAVIAATTAAIATAAAQPAKELAARLAFQRDFKHDPPQLASVDNQLQHYPANDDTWPSPSRADQLVVASSADGAVAWIATDLVVFDQCDFKENIPPDPQGDVYICPDRKQAKEDEHGFRWTPAGALHATAVWERRKTGWQPLAWHLSTPVGAKAQAEAVAKGRKPPVIAKQIEPAAADAAKLFTSTLNQLAKTVADRPDVVLYGSAPKERYVGGAAVRKQLEAWNLTFSIRDGIEAGASASGTVAWVLANVDATSPKAKAKVPYRLWTVYEKTGAAWKLVQLHFSFHD